MPTTLFIKCGDCTIGCGECGMTGYVELEATLEQVRAVLDNVPNVAAMQTDISILRSHNAAYAAENERLRRIINGDADARQ